MFCANVRNKLTAYIDNELPLKRRLAIERHLEMCVGCRKVKEEESSLNSVIIEPLQLSVPSNFAYNILERVKERSPVKSVVTNRGFKLLPIPVPVPVFAQAVILIAMLGTVFLGGYLGANLNSELRKEALSLRGEFDYISSGSIENEYLTLLY